MSKQRNYPEGFAEAVAAIPFDQMQDFARKIMQPTTPEPAPLLTNDEHCRAIARVLLRAAEIDALNEGHAIVVDSRTHVAVKKMTEAEAEEKSPAGLAKITPTECYLAALRDIGAIK